MKNQGANAVPLQPVLASKDLNQELMLTGSVYLGQHAYIQGVASAAFPGEALKAALGSGTENWYTLQASLYFFY